MSLVLRAEPRRQVRSNPVVLPAAGGGESYPVTVVELSGRSGTVRATQGSNQLLVQDLSALNPGAVQGATVPIVPAGPESIYFALNCTGTTECRVRVTVGPFRAPASSTATPSR